MLNSHRAALKLKGLLIFPLALSLLFIGACASTPPAPTTSLAEASQAIARAEQSDARQHAGSELDQAKQKLILAERAVTREDMEAAERLAVESKISAELALAKTESAKATAINREMARSAQALQEEMRRARDEK